MTAEGPLDFIQRLAVLNQAVRTLMLLALTGLLGYGGYYGYHRYVVPARELESVRAEFARVQSELSDSKKQIEQQTVEIKKLSEENDRLTTSLRLIKVDRRLAYLTVTDLGPDPETGEPLMKVLFTEVDLDGRQVGKRRIFTLKGALLNVDCWLAKFEDKYIEQADLVRGTSLCIIRGIRGDKDTVLQSIDEGAAYADAAPGSDGADPRPPAYQTMGQISDLEQKIWSDFWKVANDNQLQQELGLRAVHGQVNYIQVEAGATYQLDLRASDGGSIRKVDQPPAVALPQPDDT
ncbi:MAG: hypothetical protein JNL67_22205 [Planctomycetaceae bacterium]|nr:hypothetical protein [Planctomycetaceae bacterium]